MNTHKLAIMAIAAVTITHIVALHTDGMITEGAIGSIAGLGGYSAWHHFKGKHGKNSRQG